MSAARPPPIRWSSRSARAKRFAGALVDRSMRWSRSLPLLWIFADGLQDRRRTRSPIRRRWCSSRRSKAMCNLFTIRSRQTPEYIASLPPADDLVRQASCASATW